MAFQCTIVTPEAQTFDQTVNQVIIPAHDGQLGILSNRAPILVRIGMGPLQIDTADGKSLKYFIEGGVAQMKANKLTLLTHAAVAAETIKPDQVREQLAKAEQLPGETSADIAKRNAAVKRAQALLAVAGQ